jgi:hypothetical protein
MSVFKIYKKTKYVVYESPEDGLVKAKTYVGVEE